jgi:hypothetical protein
MRHERLSAEDATDHRDSLYGESNHATGSTRDERELYGEPRHEIGSQDDEQTLYGEPQHETSETPDLPDLELLFARMRAESLAGATVLATRTSSTATPTER